jgi:hypothetical protein
MSNRNNDGSKSPKRMTYLEWMMKIQSVHYACGEKMDRGIAVDMQNNLSNSK